MDQVESIDFTECQWIGDRRYMSISTDGDCVSITEHPSRGEGDLWSWVVEWHDGSKSRYLYHVVTTVHYYNDGGEAITDKERLDFLSRKLRNCTLWRTDNAAKDGQLQRIVDLGLHLSLRHAIDAAIKEEQ